MLGEVPGRQVGYRLRFDTRVSAATRLEIMTPGVLPSPAASFPEGCAGVIIDELHERSLDLDLVLGAAVQLRRGGVTTSSSWRCPPPGSCPGPVPLG